MDTRIIARAPAGAAAATAAGLGSLQVLRQRHEVMWRDGSSVVLHPVYAQGAPASTLRALVLDQRLLLLDLERACPGIDAELRTAHEHDHVGLVFFSLRLGFASSEAFAVKALATALGEWHEADGLWCWGEAPSAVQRRLFVDEEATAC